MVGNIQLGAGADRVELFPGSTIQGIVDGGGGNNILALNAVASQSGTFDNTTIQNFNGQFLTSPTC